MQTPTNILRQPNTQVFHWKNLQLYSARIDVFLTVTSWARRIASANSNQHLTPTKHTGPVARMQLDRLTPHGLMYSLQSHHGLGELLRNSLRVFAQQKLANLLCTDRCILYSHIVRTKNCFAILYEFPLCVNSQLYSARIEVFLTVTSCAPLS